MEWVNYQEQFCPRQHPNIDVNGSSIRSSRLIMHDYGELVAQLHSDPQLAQRHDSMLVETALRQSLFSGSPLQVIGLAESLSTQGVLDIIVVFTLFEEWFDAMEIDTCEHVFADFASFVNRFTHTHASTPSWESIRTRVQLPFLRICNAFLSRLSVMDKAHFRGRVLLQMASFLVLDEKSGLNLKNAFNLGNITRIDANEMGDLAADAFYERLWTLQDLCRNPTQMTMADKLETFIETISEILVCFETNLISGLDNLSVLEQESCFLKYLTDRNLLKLQLSDSRFRSHILVQILIILQYVLNSQSLVKANLQIPLSEKHKSDLHFLQARTWNVLDKMYERSSFVDQIRSSLHQELGWIAWKDKGCPSFLRESICFSDCTMDSPTSSQFRGCIQQLWEFDAALEDLKESDRNFVPRLESIKSDLLDEEKEGDLDPEEMQKHDPTSQWKFLRVFRSESIELFEQCEGTLEKAVESWSGKKRPREEDQDKRSAAAD